MVAVFSGVLLYCGVSARCLAGTASLSWAPVTTRVDGQLLVGGVHYRLYYGLVDDCLVQELDVAGGSTGYVIGDLSPGRYFFAVTAVDSDGLESDLSPVAYKDIPALPGGERAGSGCAVDMGSDRVGVVVGLLREARRHEASAVAAPTPGLGASTPDPEGPVADGSAGLLPDVSTHAATLSWSPVASRVDGTALSDLGGYRIYDLYRLIGERYRFQLVQVGPGITEALIEELPLTRVFFTVTAFDTQGLESAPSNIAFKDIR